MSAHKSLVLDANILIRAVLGVRVPALLSQMAEHVRFFTPDVCVTDAYTYLPPILEKRGIAPHISRTGLDAIIRMIGVLESEAYAGYEHRARNRMRHRDPNDWPIVACALLLECPIWTEDADFFGSGVAVWTTDRVALYLEE